MRFKFGSRCTLSSKEAVFKLSKEAIKQGFDVRYGMTTFGTPYFEVVDPFEERQSVAITKADRIRQMDDEELAFYLSEFWATSPKAWQKDYGETLRFLRRSEDE